MFERTRELKNLDKMEKKRGNSTAAKRTESVLKTELLQHLSLYLTEKGADSVEIEVKESDVNDFLAILGTNALEDYDFEQLSETLYKFSVKELSWD